ncbi:MAG: class I SAM-dependent methyltransferase [Bacteroidetes bacterium]|nr:class I SAM-dependent methyltransferase [Bacteroidota bacterium]
MIKTTEIASAEIVSDNPVHQRLLYAYEKASEYVSGDLLDIGCGEGRGLKYLRDKVNSYTGIDKNAEVLSVLKDKYPQDTFLQMNIPPFKGLKSESFDSVVSFQVIEHVENDKNFAQEVARVLKPGGTAILSTPNIKMSLTRNPWHVREYTLEEFRDLLAAEFSSVECLGVFGDDKFMKYVERNKKSVEFISRFDIFNLQYKLPRKWLEIPYNIANRISRNILMKDDYSLVSGIDLSNFYLDKANDSCLDLLYLSKK